MWEKINNYFTEQTTEGGSNVPSHIDLSHGGRGGQRAGAGSVSCPRARGSPSGRRGWSTWTDGRTAATEWCPLSPPLLA